MQSSELTHLPVEESHLQAKYLVAKAKQGGGAGYIDEAIDLDHEGTFVFLSPCRAVK
jgi:hypothetical protein